MFGKRKIFWFIVALTIVVGIVDLPKDYPLKFHLGKINFDRVISSPQINFNIGNFAINKNIDIQYGLDLAGGTHLVLEADMSKVAKADKVKAYDSAKNIVERRINLYGLSEPSIQQSKVGDSYRILVEIPGVSNIDQAIELIGKTAQLSFFEEATKSTKEATPSSLQDIWPTLTSLTGKNLKKAEVAFQPNTGEPQVSLEFDSDGAKMFEDITTRNVGKTVAIFLDNQLLSAPKVNEPITGGKASITGKFSLDEAKRLAISLNAGALPVPLKTIEQRNVGATLGQQSVSRSILAGIIGLLIIAVFMIVNYGLLGVIADTALIIYALIVFAVFKLIPVTLTLAGIAGFILSIGMAVDANILIFERMKEEIRWGKDYLVALKLGFDRAFPSIRDSNISSLITCGILYWFGTGIVRGFAVTLAIGIVVSLFSAITITRNLLNLIYKE